MATENTVSKQSAFRRNVSWKTFFISLSVAANIGFVVVVITMMSSHALDGMFMREGLARYCATENDDKFTNSTERTKAFRDYTCGRDTAADFFNEGFNQYLEAKGITTGS